MQSYLYQNGHELNVERDIATNLKQFFYNFLDSYEEIRHENNRQESVRYYHWQVKLLEEHSTTTLYVNFRHLISLNRVEFC